MLAEKLRSGKTVCGTMLRIVSNPAAAAIAGAAGLDFVMLDLEHGAYDLGAVAAFSLVTGGQGPGLLVRVPELSRAWVSRALDCGADGVMVPMLESVEQAERLVEWSKYPPIGGRGLSSRGAQTRYLAAGDAVQTMADANRRVLAIAQIETAAAVTNVVAIAAVEGIDALLIGPNDLAISLGKPGDLDCPEEQEAIGRVVDAAHTAGKVSGMHAKAEMLNCWAPRGMRLLMCELDTGILASGMAAIAAALAENGE